MLGRLFVSLALFSAATQVAADISLALPVDCAVGETCYIQNYFDADPSDATLDFKCNALSYNTHKGTDFAVPTVAEAQEGIDILAAASGTVLGTRDGMEDVWSGAFDQAALKGRDCGNGLVIDHGDGWHTQYCHMKSGSVAVTQGQQVTTGTILGLMGMSGRTQFPHLHISVRKDGVPIDPFNPDAKACNQAHQSDQLWADQIMYQPGGVLDVGFATKVPDYADVKLGSADEQITRTSPAIVSFVLLFGARTGDLVEFEFTGPGSFRVADTYELPRNRALLFRAIGKKRRGAPWPGGSYIAKTTLIRDGQMIDEKVAEVTIPR